MFDTIHYSLLTPSQRHPSLRWVQKQDHPIIRYRDRSFGETVSELRPTQYLGFKFALYAININGFQYLICAW